jgi:predicted aspartyl protease
MRTISAALLVLVSVASTHAQTAEQCPPLTILGSVPMQIGADGRIYVRATVNGASLSMLVDTGGFFTELAQPVVIALKLPTFHTGFRLVGLYGDVTNLATRAGFTLGTMRANSMDFMVMPAVHRFAPDVPAAGGILAPNLFRNYDLDLDTRGRRLQLISQDHCEGKVVYWKPRALAIVPVRVTSVGHVLVPIYLDGHPLTALLDTGATVSLLNQSVAQSQFGLAPEEQGTPPRGTVPGAPHARTYLHTFGSLSFAGVAVSNLRLMLVPNLIRRNTFDTSEPEGRMPDVILGMDVLRHLHLYVAYKEQKLYITPADAAAIAVSPSQPPHSAR